MTTIAEMINFSICGAQGLSVRVLDWRSRDCGFLVNAYPPKCLGLVLECLTGDREIAGFL